MSDTSKHHHDGHRARMRERFLAAKGQGMADHEILEMLLYHALPRRDTNELAHTLIEEFGSLSGVLEADAEQLYRVDGVGEGVSAYLCLVGETVRCYTADKLTGGVEKDVYDTPDKIAAFMLPRYIGVNVERVYLLLFDNGMHMIDCYHVGDGSVSGIALSTRRMVERAYRKGAAGAILTHNHPGGLAIPSGDDIHLTRQLDEAFALMEIPLLEHYVFSDRSYVPIMSCVRAQTQAEYAASSLTDLMRRKLDQIKR